ncbi:MAG: hypothetical protein K2G75_02065 [Muribaculaceae bacterium]|nr:hypothetical protein [Muribaculaceae bacterium]MDE5924085.1 hypothetical protein [Muribaculaceae bacterium]
MSKIIKISDLPEVFDFDGLMNVKGGAGDSRATCIIATAVTISCTAPGSGYCSVPGSGFCTSDNNGFYNPKDPKPLPDEGGN